jgi:hypothetical protein
VGEDHPLDRRLGGGSLQVDVAQATSRPAPARRLLVTNAITNAVNNTASQYDLNLETLDINGGFAFIQVKITNTGGTGALVGARAAFGPNEFVG